MIPVRRLNHAVLYVRDLDRACAFYRDLFGFEEVARERSVMAFLKAGGSANHHDLGLMAVGPQAPSPPRGSVGLYHLAWQVDSIDALAAARDDLLRAGAYVGESDHGATKSLYGHDPDGNEFEVMYMLPREEWGEYERRAIVAPLHLEEELRSRHRT
ncbi:MAG: glyoxalase [Chloroflexi bacterium GWC2_73_18]|nr:MAG: glyoxalase [Chloroflexi bacterium GWC2_73_18]